MSSLTKPCLRTASVVVNTNDNANFSIPEHAKLKSMSSSTIHQTNLIIAKIDVARASDGEKYQFHRPLACGPSPLARAVTVLESATPEVSDQSNLEASTSHLADRKAAEVARPTGTAAHRA